MAENAGAGRDGVIFRHIRTTLSPGMLADLHCHNFFELIYVVSGDLAHVVEGRRYRLGPGSLALVRPSTYHCLQVLSGEPYERYNILFDPVRHGVPGAERLPRELEMVDLSGNSILTGLFDRMDVYAQADPESFQELLRLLLNELCLNLLLFPPGRQREEEALSPLLTRALDYMNRNLFTIQSVDEVARALFVSPSYLYAQFRSCLHQSPKKYIQDKRLLAAQRMLRAGGKPAAVSRECGFREYTTFYRSYTALFGHSPSAEN